MHKKFSLLLCAFLYGSAFAGLFAQEPVQLKDPKAVYRHAAAQFDWPPVVGEFQREAVIQYDEKGLDIGVKYRHPSGAWADVYFYPAPGPERGHEFSPKEHFEQCSGPIARYPEARQLKSGAVTLDIHGKQRAGWHAEYLLPKGMKGTDPSKNTELYLFPVGQAWLLKFRITYPTEARERVGKLIPGFVRAFEWPASP